MVKLFPARYTRKKREFYSQIFFFLQLKGYMTHAQIV